MSDFVKEVVTKPGHVVHYLLAGDRPNGRPFYVWQMVAPTGLMFFVAPEVALTVILVLVANVISTVGYQHQIAYHYSMVVLPGLAMGTVYAISRLTSTRLRAIAVGVVGLSALCSAYLWGPLPFARHSTVAPGRPSASAVAAIESIRTQVPPNAVISVYHLYTTHLAHRERVYLWPTPFLAAHWKSYRYDGRRLPAADDVEYLMLPSRLDDHPEVLEQIRGDFTEVARAENDRHEGAVLYRRVHR